MNLQHFFIHLFYRLPSFPSLPPKPTLIKLMKMAMIFALRTRWSVRRDQKPQQSYTKYQVLVRGKYRLYLTTMAPTLRAARHLGIMDRKCWT